MAGEVIDSLLVRLGLETDAKDFREAQSMFDGVRRSALQFGAVIGAGLGVQNLTFGFAAAKDELADLAEVYGTTAQFVDSLGYALQQSGGQARDAFGSLKRMRDLLHEVSLGRVADDALMVRGFNPYETLGGVTDTAEAFERLSAAVQGLSDADAERALKALGFGSVGQIRLFSGMSGGFSNLIAEGESYARVTKEMTDRAARFQTELTRMTKAVEGVSNELSNLILDDFSSVMQAASEFLRENRSEIAGFFEKALPWLEATAVGIGTLVALQAGKKGLAMLGPLVRAGGPIAAVATAYQFSQENPGFLGQAWAPWQDQLQRWGFLGGQGDNVPAEDVWYGADGIPGFAPPPAPSIHTENHITVDARGASDPAAVEAAGRRGVEQALRKAAEQTVNDLKEGMQ